MPAELRPPSIHRVPPARLVDRTEVVLGLVRGRRVIDLGFVDEGQMTAKRERRSWLHELVRNAAREAVGIDADADGVARARTLGFDAHAADVENAASLRSLELEPADVVIAGELLEHLDLPGAFLEAVKALVVPGGVLVLTTPNAHGLTNVLAGLAGRELVNADHVAWLSWRTLTTLLGRHGWRLDELAFYRLPPAANGTRRQAALFNAYQTLAQPLFRARPNLADGIVAVARLDGGDSSRA
ncbi:MAG TPA: methyltransferase domain-containing protein [Gaiellaceae bacterium]|jgi:SAM-dependent methyltransferase